MSYSGPCTPITFACVMLALALAKPLNAEMCKWVDEDGSVHYAEICPEGIESTTIEIQAPPSPSEVDEASKRFTGVQSQHSAQEEMPAEGAELSPTRIGEMRDSCIEATLNLDVLSQDQPVYYNEVGQLQTEKWDFPMVQLENSSRYLNADAKKRAHKRWSQVKADNCTSEVSGSGIRAATRQKQKERQQRECAVWRAKLEYMERNKSFHKERLELEKLFSASCK